MRPGAVHAASEVQTPWAVPLESQQQGSVLETLVIPGSSRIWLDSPHRVLLPAGLYGCARQSIASMMHGADSSLADILFWLCYS